MRAHLLLAFLTLILVTSPGTSRADVPEADKAFLDDAIPALRAATEKATAGAHGASGTLSGVRDLLAERQKRLAELGEKHSLTDLTGIETQDEYDAEVLTSLRRVVAAGGESDTTHPSAAAMEPIEGRLGALPPLGKQPVPLMVLGYSGMALAARDSLISAGAPASVVDHVVLDHITSATDLAVKEGDDLFAGTATQSMEQDLLLARLRCPKDHAAYKLNTMKNQLKDDGGISTLYYLQCSKCGEPRVIEFPQELASRLNRMSERQNQSKPAVPTRAQRVDP